MIDTAAEIEEAYRAKLMSLSGEERLLRAARMFDAARDMVLASLPPGMEEADIRVALLRRFYGNDLDDSGLRAAEEAIRGRGTDSNRRDAESAE